MEYEAALMVVARHILYTLADAEQGNEHDLWGNYPEIDEEDWIRIEAWMLTLATNPKSLDFNAAYQYLADRAAQ